jgi:hypothetical protein
VKDTVIVQGTGSATSRGFTLWPDVPLFLRANSASGDACDCEIQLRTLSGTTIFSGPFSGETWEYFLVRTNGEHTITVYAPADVDWQVDVKDSPPQFAGPIPTASPTPVLVGGMPVASPTPVPYSNKVILNVPSGYSNSDTPLFVATAPNWYLFYAADDALDGVGTGCAPMGITLRNLSGGFVEQLVSGCATVEWKHVYVVGHSGAFYLQVSANATTLWAIQAKE